LQFVERVEVVQSSARLASVNPTRPWLVAVLSRVDGENHFDKRTQLISRYVPMTINQVGYLPLQSDWGNVFSRITNARYKRGTMILRGHRRFVGRRRGVRTCKMPSHRYPRALRGDIRRRPRR